MRKMKNILKIMAGFICLTIAVLLQNTDAGTVYATSASGAPLLTVEKYEVTEGKIVPGNDFTLTLTLKNNGTEPAADMLLNIDNPAGVAPVYGTTSQVFVKSIEPGEKKVVSLDYNSWTSITGETLEFRITIVGYNNNYVLLRIPIGSDSPFSVISSNIPTEIQKGERVNASATFTVLGTENIRDVALVLAVNGEEVGSSAIGIVTHGTTKTQGISFTIPQEGTYPVELFLRYQSETGTDQNVMIASESVQVVKESSQSGYQTNVVPQQEETINQKDSLVIGGVLILVVFFGVLVFVTKRRR